MRAALAALLAAALLGAAAAQAEFCEGEGWEALQPEVRSPCIAVEQEPLNGSSSWAAGMAMATPLRVGAAAPSCKTCHFIPTSSPHAKLCSDAFSLQDVAEEVLNATVIAFNKQYIPSEENPDDGERDVWVPCNSGELAVDVLAGCQQVGWWYPGRVVWGASD